MDTQDGGGVTRTSWRAVLRDSLAYLARASPSARSSRARWERQSVPRWAREACSPGLGFLGWLFIHQHTGALSPPCLFSGSLGEG